MKLFAGFVSIALISNFVAASEPSEQNTPGKVAVPQSVTINENKNDELFVEKLEFVMQMYENIIAEYNSPELLAIAKTFDPTDEAILKNFVNTDWVKKFLKNYNKNYFLPKCEPFSYSNQGHIYQTSLVFMFLYSAKDWPTFKTAAAFVRVNLHPAIAGYPFYSALMYHPITQGIFIPAVYEILPQLFIPNTILSHVIQEKLKGKNSINVYSYYTNLNEDGVCNKTEYTGKIRNTTAIFAYNDGTEKNFAVANDNLENRLSYFREDIGLNHYHASYSAYMPNFFGPNSVYDHYYNARYNFSQQAYYNEETISRGETFYFYVKQLYARYVLERFSNKLPIPTNIDFDGKIEVGFNPNLVYPTGQAVPPRPPKTYFQKELLEYKYNYESFIPNNKQSTSPSVYEKRLLEAAETGYVINGDRSQTDLTPKTGDGILGVLIGIPSYSPNTYLYGNLFTEGRAAIGSIVDPLSQNEIPSGALGHYLMELRDPAFYQFLSNVLTIFNVFHNTLGPYKKHELGFPGVQIEEFKVSRLNTTFEDVTVSLNNLMNLKGTNKDGSLKDSGEYNVIMQRFASKPFTYTLNVKSNRTAKAVVRIFIGPKYNANKIKFTLPLASQFFVKIDEYKVKLTSGANIVERNSSSTSIFSDNELTYKEMYKLIEKVKTGEEDLLISKRYLYGIPKRFLLPKGSKGGQEFVMFAIITETDHVIKREINEDEKMNILDQYNYNNLDQKSVGFPFDRPIIESNYNLENQKFITVKIHHDPNIKT